MSEPAFVATLLIPALNEELNIEAAIRSAIGDGRADIDVLVIDDHSTDRTAEIADSIPGVRVLPNEGRGLVDGMNMGLRRAHADNVVFLDADDRLSPGALDVMIQPLLDDPETVLVFGRTQLVDEHGQKVAVEAAFPTIDHQRVVAMAGNPVTQSGTAARRGPMLEIGGYRREGDTEGALDYDLWSRAFAAGLPIRSTPMIVCERVLNGSSMTVRGRPSQFARADRIRIRNRAAWASEYLRTRRLVELGRQLRLESNDTSFDTYVFALGRLVLAMLRERRLVTSVRIGIALVLLGPIPSGRGLYRKLGETRRRRAARGWSRWRR